jgi:hypothetical protein|tara:strand:- start:1026 stop:1310 length:285 start_codon:yes stop_codon:yes gene_type:complete
MTMNFIKSNFLYLVTIFSFLFGQDTDGDGWSDDMTLKPPFEHADTLNFKKNEISISINRIYSNQKNNNLSIDLNYSPYVIHFLIPPKYSDGKKN